jgi:endo-1,4-beta-xylanase
MEITGIETIRFEDVSYTTDDEKGHSHPADEPVETTSTITRLEVERGPDGIARGGSESQAAHAEEFDQATLVWFYERVSALGLEIMITELDVSDKGLPSDVALRDQLVAETYRRFLDVTLAFPAVKEVLSWGLTDRFTGHNRWPRGDGWAVRALPYDHCLQPKLARREIAEAFLAHDPDR